jgi:hypothetical protein
MLKVPAPHCCEWATSQQKIGAALWLGTKKSRALQKSHSGRCRD